MSDNFVETDDPSSTTPTVTQNVPAAPIIDGMVKLPAEIPDLRFDLSGYVGRVRINSYFTSLFIKRNGKVLASAYYPTGVAPQIELTGAFPVFVTFNYVSQDALKEIALSCRVRLAAKLIK